MAGDVLADASSEDWIPGHELEAETVFDHGKTSDGDSRETTADMVAWSRRQVGQTALARHLLADLFDLQSLKSRHDAAGDVDVAIFCGRKPHFHQPLSPATDRFVDLSAKAAVPDPRAVAGGHLAVEPSRAVATDLLVEVEGGECPDSEAIAVEVGRRSLAARLAVAAVTVPVWPHLAQRTGQ